MAINSQDHSSMRQMRADAKNSRYKNKNWLQVVVVVESFCRYNSESIQFWLIKFLKLIFLLNRWIQFLNNICLSKINFLIDLMIFWIDSFSSNFLSNYWIDFFDELLNRVFLVEFFDRIKTIKEILDFGKKVTRRYFLSSNAYVACHTEYTGWQFKNLE